MQKRNAIVVQSGAVDVFGHKYLGGTVRVLEDFIRTKFAFKARRIELSIPQCCAGHLLSKTDISESFAVGAAGVSFALDGKTGIMAAFSRTPGDTYQCTCTAVDIADVANRAKRVPDSFINARGNDVTDTFLSYAAPLIAGEVELEFENGLPKMLVLDKLIC